MRGSVSKKSRKKADKDTAKPARKAAEPASTTPTAPAEPVRWKPVWLELATVAFAIATVPSVVLARFTELDFWVIAAISAVLYAGAGTAALAGSRRAGRVRQSGIGRAPHFVAAIALKPMPTHIAGWRLDPLAYVVGGGTLAFDLACIGAFVGLSLRRSRRSEAPADPWDEAGAWLAKHGAASRARCTSRSP